MAGKRLLDAAKLFNAGVGVAKQHWAIRRQQWDLYTKTSGIGKTLKSQTDRVTVTASAAWDLAGRLNETGPSWQSSRAHAENAYASARTTVQETVHDVATKGSRAVDELKSKGPSETREATQSEGAGSQDLTSLRRRELQHMAEQHIPETTTDGSLDKSHKGEDTFNERTGVVSPDLSSLPRAKLPKHTESVQDPPGDLNADVFYDSPASDVGANVFQSPRVSAMMGHAGRDVQNPYANRKKLPSKPLPEMVEAEKARTKSFEQENPDDAKSTTTNGIRHDAEIQHLASGIAEEVDNASETPPPTLRESRVPDSRFGRLWQYGGLATGMAFGAVGESFRRLTGGSSEGSLMLSEGNMNRLVAKLSRMRGAALKLGQMMSFQDSKVLPATINTILQRVQDSADYMPASQRDQVLIRNLGENWRDLFSEFAEKPFAAASIGQVHKAKLASDGTDVAVKIQYPGVRNSIDSDLNNLSLLLTASRLLPKGLYLDKTIANARTELGWECDYEREAKACTRFSELVQDDSDIFAVPEVYYNASGLDVLTAEFMHGKAVTKIQDLTQAERDHIGTQILRLCLRELMEWRFMQTDPNWTNFLYNRKTRRIELLDFGASRDFPDKFVEPYVSLLIAASHGDRTACRDLSIELGYLTGHESPAMLQAHVDSILTLAEPFVNTAPKVYDFEDQTITDRVRANIGLMLKERLAPPPEETYSLHRKLSGAFLLCARLKSKVAAREMFADAVQVWEKRAAKIASSGP